MKGLHDIQHWLTSGIRYGKPVDEIQGILKDSTGVLPAHERLAIYSNSFYGRLHQIMQQEFPALRHAMDEDLFDYFIQEYLNVYPPSSYSLIKLGSNFPKFLKETRPPNSNEIWPEFLINLAQLERTFQEVFHGEAGEKSNHQNPSNFEEIKKATWTRELHCSFPVHNYFLQYKSGSENISIPEPGKCIILVYRRNYQVHLIHKLIST